MEQLILLYHENNMIAVTHQDLQNLEIRVKSEVAKEQTELRHEDRKKLSDAIWKVDDLKSKELLNDNILKTMSVSIEKLESLVTEWFSKVNHKIDWFTDKFATKEEHKENWHKITAVEKALENINLKIAGISGWFAVIIYLIEKFSK